MTTNLSRRGLWLLLFAVVLIWFSNLEYRKLTKPDEGRYAEIPREMIASGDWITPRLNGLKYFEKPVMQYWTTATAFLVFGEHQWTARLWTALTGFLGVILACFTARRLWGADAGLFAAATLGSSLLFVVMGHMNTLDMGVSFFMAASLCGFLLAQRDGASEQENRWWMYITWAALACAVLSKGLIGIVLPGAVLVLYTLIERDWNLWKRLHLFRGSLLFLLLAAPWFIAVSRANPEFFQFFFIHEHFDRFLTKVHDRYEPWWWFIPVLALGILPWLLVMVDALLGAWKTAPGQAERFKTKRYLLIWTVFIFVFFSKSDSKLASYILPIFPALALLIGARLTQISARRAFWMLLPVAFLGLLALAFSQYTETFAGADFEKPYYREYGYWVAATAAVWLICTLAGLYWLYGNKMKAGILAIAFGGLFLGQGVVTGHESLSPLSSTWALAQQIRPYDKPSAPFYSVGLYDHTLTFYLKRTLTLVDYQNEMEFGIKQEPQKWLPTLADFARDWGKQPAALAIMTPSMYRQLAAQNLPMQIIAQDNQYVVVRKP
jgi:4-amino-4-deoxy-L-arabinose transferase-like glycosyltransferase